MISLCHTSGQRKLRFTTKRDTQHCLCAFGADVNLQLCRAGWKNLNKINKTGKARKNNLSQLLINHSSIKINKHKIHAPPFPLSRVLLMSCKSAAAAQALPSSHYLAIVVDLKAI